jgi:hypothetical protein
MKVHTILVSPLYLIKYGAWNLSEILGLNNGKQIMVVNIIIVKRGTGD